MTDMTNPIYDQSNPFNLLKVYFPHCTSLTDL